MSITSDIVVACVNDVKKVCWRDIEKADSKVVFTEYNFQGIDPYKLAALMIILRTGSLNKRKIYNLIADWPSVKCGKESMSCCYPRVLPNDIISAVAALKRSQITSITKCWHQLEEFTEEKWPKSILRYRLETLQTACAQAISEDKTVILREIA